jgi:hypothetical protein
MRDSSSVALTTAQNLLRRLQNTVPRGAPFDTQTLRGLGISSALASYYIKSGWIKRLGRGVFSFPNAPLNRDISIKLIGSSLPDLHVGGKTALSWQGFRHNIATRERLVLWGKERARLPAWFAAEFPVRYVSKQLFSANLPAGFGLQPLPEQPDGPLVSVPERALLELLSEIGQGEGIEEARHIVETLRSLRSDVLTTLLQHCESVKVNRLCVKWAAELGLPWADTAREAARDNFGHGRWSRKLRDGTTLNLPA